MSILAPCLPSPYPCARTDTQAAYLYDELPFDKLKLTFGGRIERADVESSGGGPDDPNNSGAPRFGNPQTRSFTPRSLAADSLYKFSKEVALAVNLSHSERAPTYDELFANGPHTATGQFEIGSSTLSKKNRMVPIFNCAGARASTRQASGGGVIPASATTFRYSTTAIPGRPTAP